MKKFLYSIVVLAVVSNLCSCGSLEQWSEALSAVGNGLQGMGGGYVPAATTTYSAPSYTTTVSVPKEWHDCSSCAGTGRCKSCGGSGKYEYAKNGRCGVCRGTGKCAGCNGKGGWKI